MAASGNQDPYPCSQIIPDVYYPFCKEVFLHKETLIPDKPLQEKFCSIMFKNFHDRTKSKQRTDCRAFQNKSYFIWSKNIFIQTIALAPEKCSKHLPVF
jgi:hypothetical protein